MVTHVDAQLTAEMQSTIRSQRRQLRKFRRKNEERRQLLGQGRGMDGYGTIVFSRTKLDRVNGKTERGLKKVVWRGRDGCL